MSQTVFSNSDTPFSKEILDKIIKKLELLTLTPASILSTVVELMIDLQAIQLYTGPQKKEIIIYALNNYIKTTPNIPESEKPEFTFLIENIIPPAIDLLVKASKNQFVFTMQKKFLGFCC
jgi:hypothetical protein